jgi:hypothetical protein
MLIELTDAECMVLASDLEHDPFCPILLGPNIRYVDESGACWADEDATVPFVESECTCGYFRLLAQAQAKLRAAAASLSGSGARVSPSSRNAE